MIEIADELIQLGSIAEVLLNQAMDRWRNIPGDEERNAK
jgi:hypothetical protein